jgi:hypothetical protein
MGLIGNLVRCLTNNALRVSGVLLTGRRARERSNLLVVARLVRANGDDPAEGRPVQLFGESEDPSLEMAFEATLLLDPDEQATVRSLLDAFLAAHRQRHGRGEGPRAKKQPSK